MMKSLIFAIMFLAITGTAQAKELTEIELLKLKNINLKILNINQAFTTQRSALQRKAQAALNPIGREKKKLSDAIEKRLKVKLKDYTIDEVTGELTLIEKSEEKVEENE